MSTARDTGRLKFSLLITGMPREHSTPTELYEQTVALTRTARDGGFDSVVIGQHMVSGPFQYLQPMPLLARLIPETGNMRLITGILLLPLFHPIDVAEQMATLDVMSGGRVVLGVGLGYRDEELEAFGIPRAKRVRRLEESLQIIKALWAGGPVQFSGTEFALDVPPASIEPLQPGGPPIWLAAMAEKSVRRARANGCSPFVGPRLDVTTLKEWANDDALLGGAPEVPLRRELFIGTESSENIWDAALEHIGARYEIYRQWGLERDLSASSEGDSLRSYLADRAVIGTPDECIEALTRYQEAGATDIVIRCSWPTLPWDEIQRMVLLTGEQVIPAFQR